MIRISQFDQGQPHKRGVRPSRLSTAYALLGLMALSSAAAVAAVAYRCQVQLSAAERSAIEHKGAAYGSLLARQLAPAVAAGDPELAQASFEATALDRDVESLVLMSGTGATLLTRGAPHGWIEAAREGVDSLAVINLGSRFAVIAPVTSSEAPRGTLIIELSTRELALARERVGHTVAWAGFGTLALEICLAVCVAWIMDRRAAGRGVRVVQPPARESGAIELRRVELPRAVANTNASEVASADYTRSQPVRKQG